MGLGDGWGAAAADLGTAVATAVGSANLNRAFPQQWATALLILALCCTCFLLGCTVGWILRGACRSPGQLLKVASCLLAAASGKQSRPQGYRFDE